MRLDHHLKNNQAEQGKTYVCCEAGPSHEKHSGRTGKDICLLWGWTIIWKKSGRTGKYKCLLFRTDKDMSLLWGWPITWKTIRQNRERHVSVVRLKNNQTEQRKTCVCCEAEPSPENNQTEQRKTCVCCEAEPSPEKQSDRTEKDMCLL